DCGLSRRSARMFSAHGNGRAHARQLLDRANRKHGLLNLFLVKLRSRIRRPIRNFLAPHHFAASLAELQRLLPKEVDSEKLWDLTRAYRGKGWFRDLTAWQVKSEYCRLVEFVADQHPRVIL